MRHSWGFVGWLGTFGGLAAGFVATVPGPTTWWIDDTRTDQERWAALAEGSLYGRRPWVPPPSLAWPEGDDRRLSGSRCGGRGRRVVDAWIMAAPDLLESAALDDAWHGWAGCFEAHRFEGHAEEGAFFVRLGYDDGGDLVDIRMIEDDFGDPGLTCCLRSFDLEGAPERAAYGSVQRFRVVRDVLVRPRSALPLKPHLPWILAQCGTTP